jgi:hypothetical protein
MTFDDLTSPLGRRPAQRRRELPVSVPKVIATALALFLGAFVVWAVVSDDPFGGEPKVAVPIDQTGVATASRPNAAGPPSAMTATETAPQGPANSQPVGPAAQQAEPQLTKPAPPPGTKTVTIIDGKTGERHEILIPANGNVAPPPGVFSKGAK